MRFRWPIRVRLKWCPNCNVPLIQDVCDVCRSKGFDVRLNPPADIRPAFQGDIEVIKEALTNEFGDTSLINELITNKLILLNKVPHYDDMKEVLIGGVIVGRYFFDPIKLRWRWRLSRYSAEVAVRKGLVKHIIVDKVKPLDVIASTKDEDDTQYVVVNKDLEPLGIAVTRRGSIRVQTLFSKVATSDVITKNSSLNDFIKANDLMLRTLISRGIKRIYVLSSKVGLPVTISYSGGKDSLVALDLALRAGLQPEIIFNDTGLELPETIDNVAFITRHYGLNLREARPDRSFWELLEVFGPPAKDFRWCCKLVKLIPLAKLYKSLYPHGALNIVGQRGMESINRALSGNVWRNKWISHILNITPIQEWPQIAVWAYILTNKLPYNPLYECGFDRLGCYLCPAANIAEQYTLMRIHPDLWTAWEEHLLKWSSSLKLPNAWVKYSLWRWLNPSASGRRRVEVKCLGRDYRSDWISEYEARVGIKVISRELTATKCRVIFNTLIPYEGLIKQAGILGKVAVSSDDHSIEIRSPDYTIKLLGNTLEVVINNVLKTNALDLTLNIVKLVVRWVKCVNCGACTLWCPNKAIELIGRKPVVHEGKCLSCGICLEVCPISDVLVDKVVTPLLTGNLSLTRMRRQSRTITLSRSLRLNHIQKSSTLELNTDVEIPNHFFS
ncbi:MAG: phosphoadenosine phosphosulfate reductase family protein [Sulfolobales archaeon]